MDEILFPYFRQALFIEGALSATAVQFEKLIYNDNFYRLTYRQNKFFMRHFVKTIAFFFIAGLYSCASNKKLIEKQQTKLGCVKFYGVNVLSDTTYVDKVCAAADSNGIKRFYSFYPDKIVMTDARAKGLSYTIIFHKLPDNFDCNIYNRLSTWDTLVFSKSATILKASKFSHLKSSDDATGYEIEVNYLHGFPKYKKFQPCWALDSNS